MHVPQNILKHETRLTYNCAHLRSTKESLTVEGGTGNGPWAAEMSKYKGKCIFGEYYSPIVVTSSKERQGRPTTEVIGNSLNSFTIITA